MNVKPNFLNGKNGQYRDLYPNSGYDPTEYERACNTVDIAICRIFESELQVLLIKRKYEPFADKWALPGGFVDMIKSEDIETAAYRELKEETGVTDIPVRELGTFGDVNRDPRWRIISTVYYALVSNVVIDKTTIKASDDAKEYKWFNLRDLPTLAFDHNMILNRLVQKIEAEVIYSPLPMELISRFFTWAQLQNAYEILLNRKLIASNFRRDIMKDYIIIETHLKLKLEGQKGRPGTLCSFNGIIKKYK
jgi:8-oxo-dGTP diphosphatase